jgi:hypothetical protein
VQDKNSLILAFQMLTVHPNSVLQHYVIEKSTAKVDKSATVVDCSKNGSPEPFAVADPRRLTPHR